MRGPRRKAGGDLRVRRTLGSIRRAFLTLIAQEDYKRITVTQLARRAQVNKKTFYRYYESLDSLLRETQEHYTRSYLRVVKGLHYPRDIDRSVRAFFQFSARQGPAFDRITVAAPFSGIRQEMVDQVMSRTWGASPAFKKLPSFERRALLTFVEKTGLDLYSQWVMDGRREPRERVTATATALIHGGVDRLLEQTHP